ncbi:DUF5703 family protein [Sanguibacter sp. 25GB23B1]|uniref:DUF5703 family protein n=1 Tax=unclassified Sanguibacter TaxID=2645534 RepID=UPI0032B00E89
MTDASSAPVQDREGHWSAEGRQYEYRVVAVPRDASRSQTRQLLTEEAEYGRWELARSALYVGGERRVWLRRKIIRVRSTL